MRPFKHHKHGFECEGCAKETQYAIQMKRDNPKWKVLLFVTDELHLFVEANYKKEAMLKEGRKVIGI